MPEFGVSVCVSALVSSGHDTDAFSSEAALTARAATTISGVASVSKSPGAGASTKGEIPRIREEALSRRDLGTEKSGMVLTSGMRRRVPRKSRRLAKPKRRRRPWVRWFVLGKRCECPSVVEN